MADKTCSQRTKNVVECRTCDSLVNVPKHANNVVKLELVYLSKGKYCVYPRMVYRLAIVMPLPPPPFWMTENLFRSHFSPFQINTQLLFLLTKWLPAAILVDRKSLSIAFLAISDQYATFIFVHKMAADSHFRL